MELTEILAVLQDDDCKKYLDEISRIHMYTKHYLLLTEELSLEGVVLLQPLKEHRDAYDHLMRIFFLPNRDDGQALGSQYIIEHVKKALGHEYRAFFDMADWFTYTCRKYVRETLSFTLDQKRYCKKYNDFEDVRKFINDLPFQIAVYRGEKDIGNNHPLLQDVEEYVATMEKLLELYRRIQSL